MLKIAIVASCIIIAILAIGFRNIAIDNSVECANINSNLHLRELAFNESAEQYRYQTNNLDGQFDLRGDLLAWRNYLLNSYNQLQYEINNFEDRCE